MIVKTPRNATLSLATLSTLDMLSGPANTTDQIPKRPFVAFGLFLMLCGCQTPHYTAGNLPANLKAQPRASVNQMHLAGFAPSGVGSDVLGVDDLLEVTLNTGLSDQEVEPYALRVSATGAVDVPIIGEVQVAGTPATEAGRRIAAAAQQRGVYRRPQVTVVVKEQATYQVVVLGAVDAPGAHDLPRGSCDVVSALAAAGGLTEDADPMVEVLRRSDADGLFSADAEPRSDVQLASFEAPKGPRTTSIQQIDLARHNNLTASQRQLGDRDVVLVRPRDGDVIHVSGLVRGPDQFDLPPGKEIHLLDAIAMAGGRTSPVADRVYIIRQSKDDGEPVVIQASIRAAKKNGSDNLLLSPGDLISVEATALTTAADFFKGILRFSVGLSGRVATF